RSVTPTSSRGGAGCRTSCRCERWWRAGRSAFESARAVSRPARSRRSFKHTHKREGAVPPPDWSLVGGRHPPPALPQPYFFFFLAAFFFFAIRDLTSSKLP